VKLVIATFNPDKRAELADLLGMPGVEWVDLSGFPGASPPEENGDSLEANARIKAEAARRRTGLGAIADDTGLEVDALGGEPGVRAARYAGETATYADNVTKLLENLAGVPDEERTARFRTACVALLADGTSLVSEGVLEGRIAAAPRGSRGFGYDPVFVPEGETRTLAELTPDEKNAISHRARAARALARRIAEAGRGGR
jgi:XTP/dITP diphosphohydrolase